MIGLATILLVLAATAAVAQEPSVPPMTPSKPAAAEPDVAIVANVVARELRFESVGEARVSAHGAVNGQPGTTVAGTDRDNLPRPVQTYVTYRDVGIRLTITSTLPDIERLVDEALGVAPVTPQPRGTTKSRRRTPRSQTSKR